MNRMMHSSSDPQTSNFSRISKEMQQHQMQQTQQQQVHQGSGGAAALVLNRVNQLISGAYQSQDSPHGVFDSNLLLNGPQKFEFLPSHNNMISLNNGNLQHQQQQQQMQQRTSKKKKGTGEGRRPALDANGMPKERPFICPKPDCQKRFCRNDHLQRHMRIHTGQRMFQCRTCLRSFARSDHLAKHERIHSSDKPYVCLHCLRRFHKPDDHKKHVERCRVTKDDSNDSSLIHQNSGLSMYQPQMLLNSSSSSASMLPQQFKIHQQTPVSTPSPSNVHHNTNPLEVRSLIAQNR